MLRDPRNRTLSRRVRRHLYVPAGGGPAGPTYWINHVFSDDARADNSLYHGTAEDSGGTWTDEPSALEYRFEGDLGNFPGLRSSGNTYNHGLHVSGPAANYSDTAWEGVFEINATGAVNNRWWGLGWYFPGGTAYAFAGVALRLGNMEAACYATCPGGSSVSESGTGIGATGTFTVSYDPATHTLTSTVGVTSASMVLTAGQQADVSLSSVTCVPAFIMNRAGNTNNAIVKNARIGPPA